MQNHCGTSRVADRCSDDILLAWLGGMRLHVGCGIIIRVQPHPSPHLMAGASLHVAKLIEAMTNIIKAESMLDRTVLHERVASDMHIERSYSPEC